MKFLAVMHMMTYTTIIVSLIWARFRFFKIRSKITSRIVTFYDPATAVNIIATYYAFFSGPRALSLFNGFLVL